jgi:hypothetical protein
MTLKHKPLGLHNPAVVLALKRKAVAVIALKRVCAGPAVQTSLGSLAQLG